MSMYGKKWHQSRIFKLFLVLFTTTLGVLFSFVPMGGEGTGLGAAWAVSPALGILLLLIFLYAIGGSIYFFIKNV